MGFKLVAIPLIGGVTIATAGLVMVLVGGWGPCGPAGIVAHIGGMLSIYHVALWSLWDVGIVGALIIASLDWAAVLSILMAFLQDRKDSMISGRPHEKNG